MGLTFQQCQAWGLAHLWPEDLPKTGKVVLPGPRTLKAEPRKPVTRTRPDDGMNKTERAFSETLEQSRQSTLIARWDREPLTFRLAGKTRYTPDFLVWPDARNWDTRFTFVEVKGFMRDDAAVKLKVAAEMFTCFRWLLVRRAGRHGWETREVTRRGIGTTPIQVPWIG